MRFEKISLDNAAHLAAMTSIEAQIWDWCPSLPEEVEFFGRTWPEDKFLETYLMFEGDDAVAQTTVMEPYWLATPGQGQLGAGSRDKNLEHYQAIVQFGVDRLRERGFSRYLLATPSKEEGYCRVLEELGFEMTMRQKVSRLIPENLPPAPELPGVEILDFDECRAKRPETFERELWRLIQDVLADVPMPEPYVDEPFEDWTRMYFKPTLDPKTRVVAIADDRLVGLSELSANKVDGRMALTGLTGVLRDYRRRGIARAMKLASIEVARQKGVEQIFTDNEENNPMFLLNEELGFRHVWDICLYSMND